MKTLTYLSFSVVILQVSVELVGPCRGEKGMGVELGLGDKAGRYLFIFYICQCSNKIFLILILRTGILNYLC